MKIEATIGVPTLKQDTNGNAVIELRFHVRHGPTVNVDRILQIAGQPVDLSFSVKQVAMKLDPKKEAPADPKAKPEGGKAKEPLEQTEMPGIGNPKSRKRAAGTTTGRQSCIGATGKKI